jgi:hypothetical protein
MSTNKDLNVFKYTDYGNPIIYQKSDYRTSNNRAHRFTFSAEKHFVPSKAHVLCEDLKNTWNDYRPKSESSKEFSWKINAKRNHREDLAPSSSSVCHLHNFTDKVKTKGAVFPLNLYKSRFTDVPPFVSLPREPKVVVADQPKIEYRWRETHFTDTAGYFPHTDLLLSTTQIDFHPHSNYATARTNLIVHKELSFNADVASFIPKSKLIKQYPLRDEYNNMNTRDVSRFIPPSFDRIIPNRSTFVKNFGLSTEMTSSF